MDVDRFLAVHGPAWDRLAVLTGKARRGVGRLDALELDELVRLYQRTSTHLSYARTYYRDPALVARLTGHVARQFVPVPVLDAVDLVQQPQRGQWIVRPQLRGGQRQCLTSDGRHDHHGSRSPVS